MRGVPLGGAFGGEAAFAIAQDLRDKTAAAPFVGPTSSNELWSEFVSHCDAGSPIWLPIYEQGTTVRFVAQPSDLDRATASWGSPRVVYLQNASDPIGWWSPDLLLSRPDWFDGPRGTTSSPAHAGSRS